MYFESISNYVLSFLTVQLLYSVILFVLIFILVKIFKIKSPILLLGLWSLFFIRLILPLDLSHGYSGRMILQQLIGISSTEQIDDMDFEHFIDDNSLNDAHSVNITADHGSFTVESIFVVFWFFIVIILFVSYRKKLNKFSEIIRTANICGDQKIHDLLLSWKNVLNIKREIKIVIGKENISPFTAGIIRPVIYLPKDLTCAQNEAALGSIIAHELIHIKHFDDLWIKLQNIIQILYFFNPLVWIAGSYFLQTREQFCDSVVLEKKLVEKKIYGESLLTVLGMNVLDSESKVFTLSMFSGRMENIRSRIKNINSKTENKISIKIFQIFMIGTFGLIVLPMGESSISGAIKYQSELLLDSPVKDGYIINLFGKKENKLKLHKGVDISHAEKEHFVFAASAGKVTSTNEDDYFKIYKEITIVHEGELKTRYLHIDSVYVKTGEIVFKGQKIGSVTKCTHFEVYKDNQLVDPIKYLDMEVRLKK